MRFQYSNNRILEKTDFDKIENDRHKFVWYPEFDECADGEIMISIEHWYSLYLSYFLALIARVIKLRPTMMKRNIKPMHLTYKAPSANSTLSSQ